MKNKQLVRKNESRPLAFWDPFQDNGYLSSALAGLWSGLPLPHHHHHIHVPDIGGGRNWTPAVNVKETSKEYVVSAELPGLDKKDLKVDIRDGILTLSGQRREKNETREKGYLRQEQYYGSFQRNFMLPDNVKTKEVKAAYKDGLLKVTLPKAMGAKKPNLEVHIG